MYSYEDVVSFWQAEKIDNVSKLMCRLDNFKVIFAYNSNKIENSQTTYNDTREIFENGKVLNYSGKTRTLFEIQNQRTSYEYLLDKIVRKEKISVDLLKELHKIITTGTYDERRYILNNERPGEFKKNDYAVGQADVGTPPEYVAEDISNLFAEVLAIEQDKHFNPLTVSAYLHASMEFIHPFADGNGRTGRTLMNYYLMSHNYPPLVIYDEDKKNYYDALYEFDTNEQLDPLKQVLINSTIKTWSPAIDRSHGIYPSLPKNSRGR